MADTTPFLPGLSPVCGKAVDARFDGGLLSSDAGLLIFRQVEKKLKLGERLAVCIPDPRDPTRLRFSLADMIRFRVLAIVAGYEDGIDCNSLRDDPVFKMALDTLPETGPALCSQSTISRLENLPSRTELYRMGVALIDLYCASYTKVPKAIVLDLDDTFDTVHGGQQLRLFNAFYDDYGFQPIHVYDHTGRPVTVVLRPAKRPTGREIRALIKRLIARIRDNWPRVRILLRGDSHYACPEVMDFCEANGVDYVFGLAGNSALHRHVASLMNTTRARHAEQLQSDVKAVKTIKIRRFKEFWDAASTWSRVRRIVARVESSAQGTDVRYIVTSLPGGRPKRLYERLYCARAQMENFIKAHKAQLASDRTSCTSATANQFRLFLHTAAYWLIWAFRSLAPKRSFWRVAEFSTIRLRLVKIAARVVELGSRIKVHLPTSCPDHAILRLILGRIPRLAC